MNAARYCIRIILGVDIIFFVFFLSLINALGRDLIPVSAPETSFQKSMTVYETPHKARLVRALLFMSVSVCLCASTRFRDMVRDTSVREGNVSLWRAQWCLSPIPNVMRPRLSFEQLFTRSGRPCGNLGTTQ